MKILSVDTAVILKNTNTTKFAKQLERLGLCDDNCNQLGDMIIVKQSVCYYVVKPNENIDDIAKRFNMNTQCLRNLNGCNNFFAGQKIRVR